MKKKKQTFESIKFPIVRNVNARTIAQDIKGFGLDNHQDVIEWTQIMKDLFLRIKAEFDAKGIPMPTVSIDHTKGPITYGIRTVDTSGNVLHSQP